MQIGTSSNEKEITLDDSKPFVSKSDVAAGADETPAYTITGPEGYLIGIDAGTVVSPEFRDADGNKLDGSARITIQKADRQGNPIGSGIAFTELLSAFDYSKMRTDPDYFRKMQKPLMIDEREIVKVFLDIPDRAEGFSAERSRLTIGDDTSDYGQPVGIVEHSSLSGDQKAAVRAASQRSAGGQ